MAKKIIYNIETGEEELVDEEIEEEVEVEEVITEPTLEERLESMKTQTELALAELAEVILGGMM